MASPRLPFELRLAYLFPLPPIVAGFVWTVLIGGSSWAVWHFAGPDFLRTLPDGQRELNPFGILVTVSSLMWGMLPATGRAVAASELWDSSEELAPTRARDRWKREMELLREQPTNTRRLHLASLLGVIASVFLVRWIFGGTTGIWDHFAVWWSAALLGGLFVLLARGIAMTREAREKQRPIYAAAEVVDLLDLGPQLRAGRCALRTAISWLVGASLSSLFFMLGGDALTISILVLITVISVASVLPPILRVQRTIRNAKVIELQRLQIEIRRAREDVLESTQGGGEAAPGRLADLLAYQNYVDTLPELPFDKAKLAIMSLYFAVPLISWAWISLVQSWIGLTMG